ncbi:hypothetical protein EDB85DRAFT_1899083 [Lactarius pseudohatsudake]|nr:hypothetical protein EDB85DRAFT_1899083 [Lactarius pseudohatsudake]
MHPQRSHSGNDSGKWAYAGKMPPRAHAANLGSASGRNPTAPTPSLSASPAPMPARQLPAGRTPSLAPSDTVSDLQPPSRSRFLRRREPVPAVHDSPESAATPAETFMPPLPLSASGSAVSDKKAPDAMAVDEGIAPSTRTQSRAAFLRRKVAVSVPNSPKTEGKGVAAALSAQVRPVEKPPKHVLRPAEPSAADVQAIDSSSAGVQPAEALVADIRPSQPLSADVQHAEPLPVNVQPEDSMSVDVQPDGTLSAGIQQTDNQPAKIPRADIPAEVPRVDILAEVPRADIPADIPQADIPANVPQVGIHAEVAQADVQHVGTSSNDDQPADEDYREGDRLDKRFVHHEANLDLLTERCDAAIEALYDTLEELKAIRDGLHQSKQSCRLLRPPRKCSDLDIQHLQRIRPITRIASKRNMPRPMHHFEGHADEPDTVLGETHTTSIPFLLSRLRLSLGTPFDGKGSTHSGPWSEESERFSTPPMPIAGDGFSITPGDGHGIRSLRGSWGRYTLSGLQTLPSIRRLLNGYV